MKNTLLIHDFCEYYNIPEEVYKDSHRMTNDELSLLTITLLKRIDYLEKELAKVMSYTKMYSYDYN